MKDINTHQMFGVFILSTLLYLSYYKFIDVNILKQIVIIFIIYFSFNFIFKFDQIEGLTALSNESLQNLGSIYNTDNAVLTNLQVTGTLKVGNSVLINGDPTLPNKIEIYQNSDGKDPKMYFDNTGKLGVTNGTTSSYISNSETMLGSLYVKSDASIGSNLVLDGTNKWILHTPDDGRNSLYIAPYGTTDWNWNLATTLDGSTGRFNLPSLPNDAVGAIIADGRDGHIHLKIGNGKLEDAGFCKNCEDYIVLAPWCGIKLWDTGSPPNYNSDGNWKKENKSNGWVRYDMWGSNKMDYYSVYKI